MQSRDSVADFYILTLSLSKTQQQSYLNLCNMNIFAIAM